MVIFHSSVSLPEGTRSNHQTTSPRFHGFDEYEKRRCSKKLQQGLGLQAPAGGYHLAVEGADVSVESGGYALAKAIEHLERGLGTFPDRGLDQLRSVAGFDSI